MLATIATAVVTFAVTNIDDLLILTLFFSEVNDALRKQDVVIGQYLGLTALFTISLLGFFGSLVIPQMWIGLLGVAPILFGIRKWLQHNRKPDPAPVPAMTVEQAQESAVKRAVLKRFVNPKPYSVAAVTFANGGDNIGIYVPLFATEKLVELGVTLVTFWILVGAWCFAGYQLASHPMVARTLTNYGDVLLPLVLIGLGIQILLENGTLQLLGL